MPRTPYPSEFYIAHALFEGPGFPAGGDWGALTDGPADWHDLREAVVHHFSARGYEPDRETLRVWHTTPDWPSRDVTEDVAAVLIAEYGLAAE